MPREIIYENLTNYCYNIITENNTPYVSNQTYYHIVGKPLEKKQNPHTH